MNTPWMFVTGCGLFGFAAPEILAAIQKHPVPIGLNILCCVASAFIAGAFV